MKIYGRKILSSLIVNVIDSLVHSDFRCCIKTPPNVRQGRVFSLQKIRNDDKLNGFIVRFK